MITVLFVRHADIDLPRASDDPELNAAGRARAETLAHVVGAAGVTSVFTSSFLRTKRTVEPLAARLGLEPREVPPPPELVEGLFAGPTGAVVLIAGHSDTIPAMVTALGVPPPALVIGESEFDHLFVVHVAGPEDAALVHLKYGKPSA